jgi:hypothetical protein
MLVDDVIVIEKTRDIKAIMLIRTSLLPIMAASGIPIDA